MASLSKKHTGPPPRPLCFVWPITQISEDVFSTFLFFERRDKISEEKIFLKTMKKSEDTFDDHKVYKEKLYNNSNGDPLGVCLNGKSKDYLQAHVKLRDLLKKGKIFDTAYRLDEDRLWKKGQIKILNVVQTKTIVDATVQVIPQDGSKGNVQVKSHNPSNTKKKGATTELRKLPDHDFGQVLVLKSVLTNVLDGLIAGVPLEEAISKSNKVSDEKVNYHCEFCNYESKSKSGLKIQVSRIHRENKKHCTLNDL